MGKRNFKNKILGCLENLELIGITLVRGYIQFLFEGPILNTYTLPRIKIRGKIVSSTDSGYYDTLNLLIGKKILSISEDKEKEKIIIQFETSIELIISLKYEDRNCVEAVMLQIQKDGEWNVW